MTVSEIMSSGVIALSPDQTVEQAARLMARHGVGILPVCREGALCGLLTDRDIALRGTLHDLTPSSVPVREVMSRSPVTVEARADLREAARLMGEHRVRRLPVTESGRLVGMVSLGDLARSPECGMEAALALSEISSDAVEY